MKKIVFLCLTTCLLLTNLTVGYTQDADLDALRASDINADGVINILDLTLVAANLGKTPAVDQTPNTDVNGDGTVNILDLTRVASHLGKTVSPPVMFISANPAIGSQLTVDDTITLTFDNMPEDVTVSTGVATVTDKTVSIMGPFDPGALALTITWADGTQTLNYTIKPPVTFVRADPAVRSQIAVDDTITLTFDNPPEDVTVSTGIATVTDKTVSIMGPFDPGALALTITWADGSETLNYTVRVPDTEAPKITSGSVNDSDKDVDPESLNLPGRIEIAFSEEVTGNIALQTVTGADVGWRGKVEGKKGTLELVRGKELDNEITYVIAGKVSDAAGNSTDINIRFTTAPKTSGIPFAVTDATFNSLVLNSDLPVVVEFVKDG